jgi:hypothetical protein
LFWRLVHTRSADALDDAMIELLVKGSDEAQARALLAELDAEWRANREKAARSQQQDTELEPSDESAVEEEAAALAEAQHAAPVQAVEYVSEYTEPTAADFPQGVRLPPQEEEAREGEAQRE